MAVQCVLVGKGKDDMFTAIYGETTFDKVLKAYNEKKVVQVIYQNRIYYLDNTTVVDSPEAFSFISTFSNQNDETGEIKHYAISLMTGDSWSGPFLQKSTPATHANTHSKNGDDPLSPADIGAMELSENVLKQSNEDITSQVAQALSRNLVPFSGGTMTGLLNVLTPVDDSNATTKKYVDDVIKSNSGMKYEDGLPKKPSSPISDLNNYTWEQINNIALSGRAKEYFALGAIKSVTLSNAVLGTTVHNVMIIGINQDNDNSVTFQTQNCLINSIVFGSNEIWIGSNARSYCQDYYNAFPGKDYILTVSKGTCSSEGSSNRNALVDYNNETVWLPSEREMGLDSYSPISTANSTTSNAECTKGKNFSYEYYNDNSKRIKKNGDNGDNIFYWERSRAYTNGICVVYPDGTTGYTNYSTSFCPAPAFVIGNGASPNKIIQDNEDITSKVAKVLGGTKVQVVSYVGTGTYGSSNPCSLTFDFPPKVVMFLYMHNLVQGYYQRFMSASTSYVFGERDNVICATLSTEYKRKQGFGHVNDSQYGKISNDRKTLYWYNSDSAIQANMSEYTYYYLALG